MPRMMSFVTIRYRANRRKMMKRKSIALSVLIGIGIIHLTGCGNDSVSEPMETVTISDTDNVEKGRTY